MIRVAIAYLAGAWLLIQVVETLFPIYGLSATAIRVIVTLLAIGFPLALIVAWLYEITPEGIKLDKDVPGPVKIAPHSGSKLDRVIILLLVLALGYFAFDKFVLAPDRRNATEIESVSRTEAAVPDKSIAVLPFVNMSGSLEDEYFSDGLTEELIGALAQVNGLHVSARTSAFAFKGENHDIRIIGQRLNVKNVLEGSVRREGNRIRITAQLISVADGFHIWSESFDSELESMLILQETIARAIVGALRIQLAPEIDKQLRAKGTVDPEAYELNLKGRFHWAQFSENSFQQSIDAFQKSIMIDPAYAPPHAGLATVYSLSGYFGFMLPQDAYSLSFKEANRALALDPDSSEALVARGMAWLVHEWDWNKARDDLVRAMELSPNYSQAHWAYAEYLALVDPAESLDSALRALSLDPLSLPIMNSVAFKYVVLERFQEAIQMNEEMLSLDPDFAAAHWNLGLIHMIHQRFEAAIGEFSQSVELSGEMPSTLAGLGYAYAKSGSDEQALLILEKLKSFREPTQRGYAPALQIAYVYEGLGRTDDALDWLEQAFEERDGWLIYLNIFPRFESLRHEARFQDMLRRLNLPPDRLLE